MANLFSTSGFGEKFSTDPKPIINECFLGTVCDMKYDIEMIVATIAANKLINIKRPRNIVFIVFLNLTFELSGAAFRHPRLERLVRCLHIILFPNASN